ncbi:MAG TPA: DUF2917 domain-containing protein [Burkholderiaceae bacterium]|jgi:hypothetical protein
MEPKLLNSTRNSLDYVLTENHPLRFSKARGHRIECLYGTVWITAYNELDDHMLTQGQVYSVPNSGLALVEAIGQCKVRIHMPNLVLHMLHRLLTLAGWDTMTAAWSRFKKLVYSALTGRTT